MPSSSPTLRYDICTTLEQVTSAFSVLSQYPYVVLDCEGKIIGKIDGALSLICLGTPVPGPDQKVYLLDIPTIRKSTSAAQAVVSFLSRTDIIKVLWDGKMDAIEVYQTLGMELKRVLDLQVVELIARQTVLGEGEKERIQRLGPQFEQPVALRPELFLGIHAVIGMQSCLQTYLPHLNVQKDNAVSQIHKRGDSHLWMRRPIPFVLAHYAAADIRFIAHILERFTSSFFLPSSPQQVEDLITKSQRYITHASGQGYRRLVAFNAPFRLGVFMVIEALDSDILAEADCARCGITYQLPYFECRDTHGMRKNMCRICVVSAMRSRRPETVVAQWVPI